MDKEQTARANEEGIRRNSYPGRGIVLGLTPNGRNYVHVYWIMGRSENSRNRLFSREGDFIKTKAFDEAKMKDPSLIIYYPVKSLNGRHIVSNGDQTDTIYDYIKEGKTFEDALNTREYEPDYPNFTPRISGITDLGAEQPYYALAILKAAGGKCLREYYYYKDPQPGYGHCVHTYREDGDPLPSFAGEPYAVRLYDEIQANADYYWDLLNRANRISLMVKFIGAKTNKTEYVIINANAV